MHDHDLKKTKTYLKLVFVMHRGYVSLKEHLPLTEVVIYLGLAYIPTDASWYVSACGCNSDGMEMAVNEY